MYVTVYKWFICQMIVIFYKSVPGWNLVERIHNNFSTYSLLSWIIITVAHSYWFVGMWVISCARKAVCDLLTQVEKCVVAARSRPSKSFCTWCKTNMTKSYEKKSLYIFLNQVHWKYIFLYFGHRVSMLKVYMFFGNMLEQTN